MTEQLLIYANHLGANSEVLTWLQTTGTKNLKKGVTTESEMEHILDYLVSSAAPTRLQKMAFQDAKRKATEWSTGQQKKGKNLKDEEEDLELVHDFLDGTRIVRLKTKKALQREGFLMGHCVGGYDASNSNQYIYSYRDAKNQPHATFEVQKANNEIVQIKGKGNGAIHPKYIHPILAFLKTIGMNIRPSDMSNLGYYHVKSELLQLVKVYELEKQVVVLNGESYAY